MTTRRSDGRSRNWSARSLFRRRGAGKVEGVPRARCRGPVMADQKLVLIVDDDEWSNHSVGKYLELKGYSVVFADPEETTVEFVKEQVPTFVFMNVLTSDTSGIEAIRRLRTEPEMRDVPIIALAKLAVPGERERCIEAGAAECLAKPVVMKELGSLLRRLSGGMGVHG